MSALVDRTMSAKAQVCEVHGRLRPELPLRRSTVFETRHRPIDAVVGGEATPNRGKQRKASAVTSSRTGTPVQALRAPRLGVDADALAHLGLQIKQFRAKHLEHFFEKALFRFI